MGELIKNENILLEDSLIRIFADDMMSELRKNSHKGSILEFTDFDKIVTELEYHKAKLFLAIRLKNKGAIREYLADTGNFLVAIGNVCDVFSDERNEKECFEINKDVDHFVKKKVSEQSRDQHIV